MNKTEVSEFIDKTDNSYSILALLSASTRQLVAELISQLSDEIGDALWPMPNDSLHITLCEIIQPKPYMADKQQLFDAHAEVYKTLPAEIIKRFKPITVNFDKIEVSAQAITIQGSDDGSFNNIRKQLVEKLPFPKETRTPPDIIHSTIARFAKSVDLGIIRNIISNHPFNHEKVVAQFNLTHCTVPPLEKFSIIRKFDLKK